MRRIHRLTALIASVTLVAGGAIAAAGPAAAKECRTWGAQPPSEGDGDNWFEDVSLVSACAGWAVGSYHHTGFGVDQNLIQRWNGTAWKIVASPNVGGDNYLLGVDALSSNVVWAVGNAESGIGGVAQTLILRWNGSEWTVKASPNVGGSDMQNYLEDVSVIPGGRAYAVGYFDGGAGAYRTLILRWNGSTWKRMKSPNVGDGHNSLRAVVALSETNVWAVGEYYDNDLAAYRTLVLHWNGSSWKRVASPSFGTGQNYLDAIAARSASDLWAVGNRFGSTSSRTLILHWNGKAWTRTKSPSAGPYNNLLHGVVATTASNAWAVGRALDPDNPGVYRSLILHWNGSRWRIQAHPTIGDEDAFAAIDATSSTNAWAVGWHSIGPTQPLAMHCC